MRQTIIVKEVWALPEGKQGPDGNKRVKIGMAFVNRDDSINVILDIIPKSGRFQIRDRVAKNHDFKLGVSHG